MTDVPSNLIPTRITQLPEYEGDSTEGYTPYAVEGRTYKAKLANIVAPLADDVAIAAAAAEAARDAALAYKFQTEALVQDGADSALLSQAWAEGTEPGGPNTDSSKGWSYQSQGFALSLETDAAGGFYDSLAAGVADPAVEVGDAFNIIEDGRHYVGQKTGPATGEIIAEYATTGFAEAISGPGGAGEVGFTQAGTGAVARTVQAKLRDVVSVEDFGVVGDGVADDRAKVQQAITAAAALGKPLDLAGLTLNCPSTALNVTASIDGSGGKIIGRLQVDASDILLKDFEVESDNALYGIYVRGTSGAYLADVALDNVTVRMGAGTTEAFRLGMNATYVDRLVIRNSRIDYGVQLAECENYRIENNHFDGEYKNVNELLHASVNSHGIVTGNTFTRSLDNFIDLYSSGARTVVSGNRFIGCKTRLGTAFEVKISFSDDPNNTSGPALGYSEQIVIADNIFTDIEFAAVQFTSVISVYYIDSRAAPPAFTWADAPRNMRISGNIFDGFDGASQGTAAMLGIYLYRCTAIDIDGNIFRNFSKGASGSDFSSCVWVEDCKDVKITNNRGCVKDAAGITFHGENTDITSAGNHWLKDEKMGWTAKYGCLVQKLGTRADPTIIRASFTGDKFLGSLEGFRQNYAAAGSLTDVTFTVCDFQESSQFARFSRCKWIGNRFACSAGKNHAVATGNLNAISSGITFLANTLAPTSLPGLVVYRCRRGNIQQNEAITASDGIFLYGTSTAGELDYLNIRDNFSVAQSSAQPLPRAFNVNAADTATQQLSNNQKVAS